MTFDPKTATKQELVEEVARLTSILEGATNPTTTVAGSDSYRPLGFEEFAERAVFSILAADGYQGVKRGLDSTLRATWLEYRLLVGAPAGDPPRLVAEREAAERRKAEEAERERDKANKERLRAQKFVEQAILAGHTPPALAGTPVADPFAALPPA